MHELYQGMQDIQKERMEVFLIGVMLARRSDKVPEWFNLYGIYIWLFFMKDFL